MAHAIVRRVLQHDLLGHFGVAIDDDGAFEIHGRRRFAVQRDNIENERVFGFA